MRTAEQANIRSINILQTGELGAEQQKLNGGLCDQDVV